ncbi:hypothetical protein Tco_1453447, partial [Tanacetum coccineum]
MEHLPGTMGGLSFVELVFRVMARKKSPTRELLVVKPYVEPCTLPVPFPERKIMDDEGMSKKDVLGKCQQCENQETD